MEPICPKCGREMTDKNDTGGHICYETAKVRVVQIEKIEQLQAENERLKIELKASDNWLHRLLKSCVIMLDDGEVTKRAVEKQSRYNQQTLKGKQDD